MVESSVTGVPESSNLSFYRGRDRRANRKTAKNRITGWKRKRTSNLISENYQALCFEGRGSLFSQPSFSRTTWGLRTTLRAPVGGIVSVLNCNVHGISRGRQSNWMTQPDGVTGFIACGIYGHCVWCHNPRRNTGVK